MTLPEIDRGPGLRTSCNNMQNRDLQISKVEFFRAGLETICGRARSLGSRVPSGPVFPLRVSSIFMMLPFYFFRFIIPRDNLNFHDADAVHSFSLPPDILRGLPTCVRACVCEGGKNQACICAAIILLKKMFCEYSKFPVFI